MQDNNQLDIKW